MDVIDVSGWPDAMDEPLGTKPKQWLRHPADDQLWLWKKATWHRGPAGVRLRRGDDWAEKVASVVGGMLDVPVATVELATRHGDAGVISRSVLSDGQELAHGNELLAGFTGVVRDPRDRHDHTIEVIAQVLDGVGPPPGKTAGKAMDWFAGYLILDALISNTDRHQENWAVIDDGGERWLSPSFDHASSLGFQLTDAERDERLTTSDHQRTVAAYANRAKSKFEGEIHPRDAALDAFRRVSPTFREHWREAVASLPVGATPYHGLMTTHSGTVEELRLYVSWRSPEGPIHPIGLLRRQRRGDGEAYSFRYLKLAERLPDFEPLPGLPDLYGRYESRTLFPVFANRVMPRHRPEFDLLARRADLSRDADPFEVMARTGGRRATDRIEVFAPPRPTPDGRITTLFFVRGIRYVTGAAEAIEDLSPGELLRLVDDRENPYNPQALLLHRDDELPVGYVPDYLVDHVHDLRHLNGHDPDVIVEHVNDADTAPHLRVLCRMDARQPEGYRPFSDARFQPLVPLD